MKTRHLENKITKVPFNKNYFTRKYRQKYNVKIPSKIDSLSIYKEVFYRNLINNNKSYRSDGFSSAYKFYSNGCVSEFVFKETRSTKFDFNPNINGYRGVSYLKNGKQLVSLVIPVTGLGRYSVKNYEISVKGDTLFIKYNDTEYVYVKNKIIGTNILKYIADW